jgi:hypothetical protein
MGSRNGANGKPPQLHYWPIGKPKPSPTNAKKHSDDAIERLARVIDVVGQIVPIYVDEKGEILKGHRTLLALKALKAEQALVFVKRGLTPHEKEAWRLADNRLSEDTPWDDELLRDRLQWLDAGGFDLTLTGFSEEQLTALMGGEVDATGMPALPTGEKAPFEQMTFTLHTTQADIVREALDAAKGAGDFIDSPNENSNGNALARLAELALGALR